MANFKGGFAFNNEAAKAEVEQAPDGTLISCVNPVTGESLGGGGSSDFSTATVTITESYSVAFPAILTVGDLSYIAIAPQVYNVGVYDIVLYKGHALLTTEATVEGNAELIDEDEGVWDVSGAITLS
jgi:hypothetical protein